MTFSSSPRRQIMRSIFAMVGGASDAGNERSAANKLENVNGRSRIDVSETSARESDSEMSNSDRSSQEASDAETDHEEAIENTKSPKSSVSTSDDSNTSNVAESTKKTKSNKDREVTKTTATSKDAEKSPKKNSVKDSPKYLVKATEEVTQTDETKDIKEETTKRKHEQDSPTKPRKRAKRKDSQSESNSDPLSSPPKFQSKDQNEPVPEEKTEPASQLTQPSEQTSEKAHESEHSEQEGGKSKTPFSYSRFEDAKLVVFEFSFQESEPLSNRDSENHVSGMSRDNDTVSFWLDHCNVVLPEDSIQITSFKLGDRPVISLKSIEDIFSTIRGVPLNRSVIGRFRVDAENMPEVQTLDREDPVTKLALKQKLVTAKSVRQASLQVVHLDEVMPLIEKLLAVAGVKLFSVC